jgi:hypothetical protein
MHSPPALWSANGRRWNSPADYRAEAIARFRRDVAPVGNCSPLLDNDIPLFAVMKNERILIRAFLDHYRWLGVSRFFFVDTGSTDGTLEFLAGQPDVDVWTTSASFGETSGGRRWIDGLISSMAMNRWLLHADIDEFLVFAGMRQNSIRSMIGWLKYRRLDRLFAPMLDVYGDRPIRDTIIHPEDDPLKICQWFDATPDILEEVPNGIMVNGGARCRLFGNPKLGPVTGKYPLVFYDGETTFVSPHYPTPYARNSDRTFYGRLLHVKLHSGFIERLPSAVEEKQYFNGAMMYRRYLEATSEQRELSAMFPHSKRYSGPQSLIDAGMMKDPRPTIRRLLDRLS